MIRKVFLLIVLIFFRSAVTDSLPRDSFYLQSRKIQMELCSSEIERTKNQIITVRKLQKGTWTSSSLINCHTNLLHVPFKVVSMKKEHDLYQWIFCLSPAHISMNNFHDDITCQKSVRSGWRSPHTQFGAVIFCWYSYVAICRFHLSERYIIFNLTEISTIV